MPEVPELLTLRHNLLTRFKNQVLTGFEINNARKVKPAPSQLISAVVGMKLKGIERSGKTLEFQFNKEQRIGLHLMQSGRPYLLPAGDKIKWSIFEMAFGNGLGFGIHDPSGQASLSLNPAPGKAPDVLSKDLTFDYLKAAFGKSKTMLLKPLLTNPVYIRGLGNAYVDEILWEIKVSPASVASSLPDEKIHQLLAAITSVLEHGEKQVRLLTGSQELMIEKRDFMNVHNHKRKTDPNGEEILKGEVGKAKTYWTKSQKLYE